MTFPLDAEGLKRLAFLHSESLPDWYRRFARERGMTLTESDIHELMEMDAQAYPNIARRERQERKR